MVLPLALGRAKLPRHQYHCYYYPCYSHSSYLYAIQFIPTSAQALPQCLVWRNLASLRVPMPGKKKAFIQQELKAVLNSHPCSTQDMDSIIHDTLNKGPVVNGGSAQGCVMTPKQTVVPISFLWLKCQRSSADKAQSFAESSAHIGCSSDPNSLPQPKSNRNK